MDVGALALSLTREQFRARFECYFLCADLGVAPPTRPQRTEAFVADDRTTQTHAPVVRGEPFAAPLVKVQPTFPSMITLGRTLNNDIVINHTSISKFHAYFRVAAGTIEVADAGSRNGTYVGAKKLVPKQAEDRKSIRLNSSH